MQYKNVKQYKNRVIAMVVVMGMSMGLLPNVALAGGYLGISAGQTDLDLSGYGSDTSYSLAAGMDLLDSLAVELAYVDLLDTENDSSPASSLAVDGINLSLVVNADIGKNFGVFGRVGMFAWDSKLDLPTAGREKDDGVDMNIGFGGFWQITEKIRLNLSLHKYKLDDDDADSVTLGMAFGL